MLLSLVAAVTTCGCSTARFYSQAVHGQLQILSNAESIERLQKNEDTDPLVVSRLALIRELCDFATTELALDPGRVYQRYVDLGRPFVVWNIYAAPEFSLDDKTWWYPVIGDATYRGYFRKDYASEYAARLTAEGFDVHLGGVEAYSTLGWFDDPVFNTMIDEESEVEIAATVFHELAHRRLYINGDSEFNEAFATTVEQNAVRRWLTSRNDTDALAQYEHSLQADQRFVKLVEQTRARLAEIYDDNSLTADEMRNAKHQAITDFKETMNTLSSQFPGEFNHRSWIDGDVNNARLNTVDTYHQLVPDFNALLHRLNNDLDWFYSVLEDLKKLTKDERVKEIIRFGTLH